MLAGGGGVGRGAACPCSFSLHLLPLPPSCLCFYSHVFYSLFFLYVSPRVTSTAMRVAPPGGWGGEGLGAPPGLLSEGRGRFGGATKRRDTQDLHSCAARSGSHVDFPSPEIRMAAAAGQAWGRGDTAAVARRSGSATPAVGLTADPWAQQMTGSRARREGASRASGGATGGRVGGVYTNSPALHRSHIVCRAGHDAALPRTLLRGHAVHGQQAMAAPIRYLYVAGPSRCWGR